MPRRSLYRQHGITLFELMIVVVIVGIIAAVGYPSYQGYTRQAKRSDAQAALTRMAAQQERWYADNNTYTDNATDLGYCNNNAPSNEGYWTISVVAANTDNTRFAVQAVPSSWGADCTDGTDDDIDHADAACTTITLTSTGRKTP
ncbi:MAG: type IV pilin protein, partial [Gammaproteobacteria bacterium]